MLHKDLLISGSEIGDSDDTCYFAIFKSSMSQKSFDDKFNDVVSQMWTLGTIVLKQYYVVLYMTPYDERQEEYIQVGIAPINPDYSVAAYYGDDGNSQARDSSHFYEAPEPIETEIPVAPVPLNVTVGDRYMRVKYGVSVTPLNFRVLSHHETRTVDECKTYCDDEPTCATF